MKNYAVDLARNVLRRKRESGGADDGVVYDANGMVAMPAISYVDPEEEKKKQLVERAQEVAAAREEPVYDVMGAVAVPPQAPAGAEMNAYDRAMSKIGEAGAAVGSPIVKGLTIAGEDYRKNLAHHTESAAALQSQANKDAAGERGWQGRLLAPLQSANAMMSTAFAPVSAAATTVGHGAEWLTGNKGFGERAEFLAGLADPSHIGMAKAGMMKAAKFAEDVAPYSAMFVPVAKADPALAAAKQMRTEGKTAEEIHGATGIHFGPESYFSSYELEPSSVNPGRMERVGYMPDHPEPRPFKEISDENLVLNRDNANDKIVNPKTGESVEAYTFEHPELAKQFPELANLHTNIKIHPDFHPTGSYGSLEEVEPGKWAPTIKVRASSPEEARIIVAHELQHFVADKGGLEQGNSMKNPQLQDFHAQVFAEAQQTTAQAEREINAAIEPVLRDYAEFYNIDPNSANGRLTLDSVRQQLENEWWKNLQQNDPKRAEEIARSNYIENNVKTPYEMYQHMYGEALARATEERINMLRAERGQAPVKFNYHEYGKKGEADKLRQIPEEYLFSDQQLIDFAIAQDEKGGYYRQ